jgi:hypothetical protein
MHLDLRRIQSGKQGECGLHVCDVGGEIQDLQAIDAAGDHVGREGHRIGGHKGLAHGESEIFALGLGERWHFRLWIADSRLPERCDQRVFSSPSIRPSERSIVWKLRAVADSKPSIRR